MTPDELRALADAFEPMASAPRFEDINVPEFCRWLRAQAEAQPVAMLASHRRLIEQAIQSAEHPSGMSTHDGKARIDASILRRMLSIIDSSPAVPAGWKPVPVEPTPEMLSAVGMMDGYDWHAPGCSPDADHANWYSAMIAAAPAAPQGEPKRNQPLRDLLAVIHCDGGHHTEAVGIDQSIKDAQAAVCELKRELAMAKREPLSDERIAEIQRAAYERAAQECHAQKGGLSSEWGDGHDTGCDDCFAAIRALGGQHD